MRAARNAGIVVPKKIIDEARTYLEKCTTSRGGVIYSLASGGHEGGPALVAAAIAGGFSTGDYSSPLVKKWFTYCRTAIPVAQGGRFGHDEYTHYYFAQCVYILADDGWEKLYGSTPANDRLTWSGYRAAMFDQLHRTQNGDGSWSGGGGFSVGPVYSTAMYCTIMQLDKATLPIYQR